MARSSTSRRWRTTISSAARPCAIGIFLSIFNVHINRAPLAGRVVEMHYQPGEFLNAMRPESARAERVHVDRLRDAETPRRAVRRAANLRHAGPANRLHAAARSRRSRAARSLV